MSCIQSDNNVVLVKRQVRQLEISISSEIEEKWEYQYKHTVWNYVMDNDQPQSKLNFMMGTKIVSSFYFILFY